jgi:hypothetical protein
LAHRHRIKLVFSRPGTPTDNPYIEAFNGRFHAECLDQHWFASLEEARHISEAWRLDYNEVRPHTALDNQTPAAYKAAWSSNQAKEETGYHTGWTRYSGHFKLSRVSHIAWTHCRGSGQGHILLNPSSERHHELRLQALTVA